MEGVEFDVEGRTASVCGIAFDETWRDPPSGVAQLSLRSAFPARLSP